MSPPGNLRIGDARLLALPVHPSKQRGQLAISPSPSLTVSALRFNGHFPGGPRLVGIRMSLFWIILELRMMEVVVTTMDLQGRF